MDIIVKADSKNCKIGLLTIEDQTFKCALGRCGISERKVEGDGCTPSGVYILRKVMFRADRYAKINTGLVTHSIQKQQGWCNAPNDTRYNCLVSLPHIASAEKLWRRDRLYDIVVVIGYNDKPVICGLGSAIFLHIKKGDFRPTEGCIALKAADLLKVLSMWTSRTKIRILNPTDHQI
jgi:L,D-peptidoglycan transpeptidase YkuD (ErfK/YbiS/YcfS/YnhG family)